jgi:hypothetical protein
MKERFQFIENRLIFSRGMTSRITEILLKPLMCRVPSGYHNPGEQNGTADLEPQDIFV